MEVDVRITTAALLIFAVNFAIAQTTQGRCSYMTAIPRGETPVFEDNDYNGVPWSQQPLIPMPQREELCMEETNNRMTTIFMEEEIEEEIAIAKLNYQGTGTPTIVEAFSEGTFQLLGPVLRRDPENGDWHLVITQRQDYEVPSMQRYMFDISAPGEQQNAIVVLLVVNIDDNPPIIHMIEPCTLPEPGEIGRTSCVYTVSDADGQLSTRFMTYDIESNRDDDDFFDLVNEYNSLDWMNTNMVLYLKKELDFEINPLHIFTVTALDSKPNNHTVIMMVQVQNVDRRNPRWVEIFAVQQFNEKTNQTFTVRAIDGDTGINKPIYYTLEADKEDTFFSLETIEGGRSGAILSVSEIDRDTLQRDMFQLSIVAYKYGDDDEEGHPSFQTRANIVIIVIDVNDQRPVPLHPIYTIDIMEETPMTLNLAEFGFNDRDIGENARYEVRLESIRPEGAEKAFTISPTVGYQEQTFIVSTRDHRLLDFEVEEYQEIQLKVIATDMNDTRLYGEAILEVNLINWNDEDPIFEVSSQTVSFQETVLAGYTVATVKASDRDIDDHVVHTLLGNAEDYLTIDQDTGEIFVAYNDSFDYHRQNELFVQILATDTLGAPYNTATFPLVIQLIDVNNTPPSLRLPRGSPYVEENVPEGFMISDEITAFDPDTTAELEFQIIWETSYATKQGRMTPAPEYLNCVTITTIPGPTRHTATGRLDVREIRDGVTIDYEEFEILYLTVRVYDRQTVLGDTFDESILAVNIIDMNDNAPQWAEGSLTQELRVREAAAAGVVIGSVLATDIDGPLYNQVRYSIQLKGDTPPDLVTIHPVSGQLSVLTAGAIDADQPKRLTLEYRVVASDRCVEENEDDCPDDPTAWDTPGDLSIFIIDTNNKIPQPEYPEMTVYVWENATSGDEVVQLTSSDLDRDDMYSTVKYQIMYAVNTMLRNLFAVDQDTGLVYVHYTTDQVLDRDGDYPNHTIFLNLLDNFYSEGDGNRNQNETSVLVILLDVNDNAPELPEPHELSWSVSEDLGEGERVLPYILAPDRDEPNTDNSRVGYAILDLSVTDREMEVPELFNMIQIQNVSGELETARHLKGYWGTYDIHIQAYDHGIPQQMSDMVYSLVIRPYNYYAPVFVFPDEGTTIRLSRERSIVNGVLMRVTDEELQRVSATDADGLHAGAVSFSVTGDAAQYFDIRNFNDNSGELYLHTALPLDNNEFQVTIRGTDGGTEPGQLSTDVTFTLIFVPTTGEPVFNVPPETVAFVEKEAGMSETRDLPRAVDPKNYMCEEMNEFCHQIYYSIIEGNEEGYFNLAATTNQLSLARELDRSEASQHVLRLAASNAPHDPASPPAPVLPSSSLIVTVNVREADPRPQFESPIYSAGIYDTDTPNTELLTVKATHTENLDIRYSLDLETMVVDPSLEAVKDSAFILHPETGVLSLNINPLDTMVGMFEFDVVATDEVNATDRTDVKIYLITHLNRVYFLFNNTLDVVDANRDYIAGAFSEGFSLTCNIDGVVRATDSAGVARDDRTEVRAHFIRNNVPATAEEIEQLRSNTLLLRSIQDNLLLRDLQLEDFTGGSSPELAEDPRTVTIYVLAALAALLGFMCVVLLVTFIIRTRALNRRLEALSMTKYGSVDSGLNRVGLAAPGTNKHAVEGSNPIWNETIKAPDFDAISDVSYDSDLIGIEDLPQFRSDYFPPGDDSSMQGIVLDNQNNETVATHGNNFKFNASPFSPEFGNTPIRR